MKTFFSKLHISMKSSLVLNELISIRKAIFNDVYMNKTMTFLSETLINATLCFAEANSDLVICKLSHCTAPAMSGIEMVLLCEKVCKEDIQVRFFEEINGQVVWESFGEFQPSAVHKQVPLLRSICNLSPSNFHRAQQ